MNTEHIVHSTAYSKQGSVKQGPTFALQYVWSYRQAFTVTWQDENLPCMAAVQSNCWQGRWPPAQLALWPVWIREIRPGMSDQTTVPPPCRLPANAHYCSISILPLHRYPPYSIPINNVYMFTSPLTHHRSFPRPTCEWLIRGTP